jgi:hypothetical protein
VKLLVVVVIAGVVAGGPVARADDLAAHAAGGERDVVVGVGFGVIHDLGTELMIEAAVRPLRSVPVRAHVLVGRDKVGIEDYDDVSYVQARGGVELDSCPDRGGLGLLLDLDLGVLHTSSPDYGPTGMDRNGPESRTGLLVAARGGIETGGRNVRFRLVLDVAAAVTGSWQVHGGWGDSLSLANVTGLEGELALVF